MADETLSSPQLPESGAPHSLWSTLSRWWGSQDAPQVDTVGYESALPWALGSMAGGDRDTLRD